MPNLTRLAILTNADDVSGALEVQDAKQAAGALGIDVIASEIRLAKDIAPALANLHGPALALYVVADALTNTHASEISALALAARLPTIYAFRQLLESGGLLSFGLDALAQYRGAGALVDKILRGVWPADIPVAPPSKLELAVNLKTAKRSGLTVLEFARHCRRGRMNAAISSRRPLTSDYRWGTIKNDEAHLVVEDQEDNPSNPT